MIDIFRRYCAGESLRQIVAAAAYSKGTVSHTLHAVQNMIGHRFIRARTTSIKDAVRRTTQEERADGQRAASVRDWHALRATWVTLALTAGVPMEQVRRVTGHATVEIIMKHYYRPNREQIRADFAKAMPGILADGTDKPLKMKPVDELAALIRKVQDATATEADKNRLRVLAAKV